MASVKFGAGILAETKRVVAAITADKNKGLVNKWARKYADESVPERGEADLWQDGFVALMEAAMKWGDADTDSRDFRTFASGVIRKAVRTAALRVTPCGARMDDYDAAERAGYLSAANALAAGSRHEPTADEVMEAMGVGEFRAARIRAGNALATAAPVPSASALASVESQSPPDSEHDEVTEYARALLALATPREREFISIRLGIGRPAESDKQHAARIGRTPALVSKVVQSGLKRIKANAGDV